MICKTNYGLSKEKYSINEKKFNNEYLAGFVHTDGSIKETKNHYNRVVFSQKSLKFLRKLKEWYNEKGINTTIYEPQYHLYCYNPEVHAFFKNYNTYNMKNPRAYLTGIIDGDGSFCSHTSSSGVYWRFQIGLSKERKVLMVSKMLNFFNLKYTLEFKNQHHKTRKPQYMFTIQSAREIMKLLNLIEPYIIVKEDIVKIIKKEINKFINSNTYFCKRCGKSTYKNFYCAKNKKTDNLVNHCHNELCKLKYNRLRNNKSTGKHFKEFEGNFPLIIKELIK